MINDMRLPPKKRNLYSSSNRVYFSKTSSSLERLYKQNQQTIARLSSALSWIISIRRFDRNNIDVGILIDFTFQWTDMKRNIFKDRFQDRPLKQEQHSLLSVIICSRHRPSHDDWACQTCDISRSCYRLLFYFSSSTHRLLFLSACCFYLSVSIVYVDIDLWSVNEIAGWTTLSIIPLLDRRQKFNWTENHCQRSKTSWFRPRERQIMIEMIYKLITFDDRWSSLETLTRGV